MRWMAPAFALFLSTYSLEAGAFEYCEYGTRANLILVDRTTAYDDQDKRIFAAGLAKIVDSLGAGDRVLMHAIVGDFAQSTRAFDQCVPGCPEQGLREWFLSDCRDLQAKADRTRFIRRLALMARGMLDDVQTFPRSDIVRSIARVTTEFRRADTAAAQPLDKVYIFSDLIENSTELPWPAIVEASPAVLVRRLNALGITPDLVGADVHAFGFGRFHDKKRSPLRAATEAQVRAFWRRFLRGGGAVDVRIQQRLE